MFSEKQNMLKSKHKLKMTKDDNVKKLPIVVLEKLLSNDEGHERVIKKPTLKTTNPPDNKKIHKSSNLSPKRLKNKTVIFKRKHKEEKTADVQKKVSKSDTSNYLDKKSITGNDADLKCKNLKTTLTNIVKQNESHKEKINKIKVKASTASVDLDNQETLTNNDLTFKTSNEPTIQLNSSDVDQNKTVGIAKENITSCTVSNISGSESTNETRIPTNKIFRKNRLISKGNIKQKKITFINKKEAVICIPNCLDSKLTCKNNVTTAKTVENKLVNSKEVAEEKNCTTSSLEVKPVCDSKIKDLRIKLTHLKETRINKINFTENENITPHCPKSDCSDKKSKSENNSSLETSKNKLKRIHEDNSHTDTDECPLNKRKSLEIPNIKHISLPTVVLEKLTTENEPKSTFTEKETLLKKSKSFDNAVPETNRKIESSKIKKKIKIPKKTEENSNILTSPEKGSISNKQTNEQKILKEVKLVVNKLKIDVKNKYSEETVTENKKIIELKKPAGQEFINKLEKDKELVANSSLDKKRNNIKCPKEKSLIVNNDQVEKKKNCSDKLISNNSTNNKINEKKNSKTSLTKDVNKTKKSKLTSTTSGKKCKINDKNDKTLNKAIHDPLLDENQKGEDGIQNDLNKIILNDPSINENKKNEKTDDVNKIITNKPLVNETEIDECNPTCANKNKKCENNKQENIVCATSVEEISKGIHDKTKIVAVCDPKSNNKTENEIISPVFDENVLVKDEIEDEVININVLYNNSCESSSNNGSESEENYCNIPHENVQNVLVFNNEKEIEENNDVIAHEKEDSVDKPIFNDIIKSKNYGVLYENRCKSALSDGIEEEEFNINILYNNSCDSASNDESEENNCNISHKSIENVSTLDKGTEEKNDYITPKNLDPVDKLTINNITKHKGIDNVLHENKTALNNEIEDEELNFLFNNKNKNEENLHNISHKSVQNLSKFDKQNEKEDNNDNIGPGNECSADIPRLNITIKQENRCKSVLSEGIEDEEFNINILYNNSCDSASNDENEIEENLYNISHESVQNLSILNKEKEETNDNIGSKNEGSVDKSRFHDTAERKKIDIPHENIRKSSPSNEIEDEEFNINILYNNSCDSASNDESEENNRNIPHKSIENVSTFDKDKEKIKDRESKSSCNDENHNNENNRISCESANNDNINSKIEKHDNVVAHQDEPEDIIIYTNTGQKVQSQVISDAKLDVSSPNEIEIKKNSKVLEKITINTDSEGKETNKLDNTKINGCSLKSQKTYETKVEQMLHMSREKFNKMKDSKINLTKLDEHESKKTQIDKETNTHQEVNNDESHDVIVNTDKEDPKEIIVDNNIDNSEQKENDVPPISENSICNTVAPNKISAAQEKHNNVMINIEYLCNAAELIEGKALNCSEEKVPNDNTCNEVVNNQIELNNILLADPKLIENLETNCIAVTNDIDINMIGEYVCNVIDISENQDETTVNSVEANIVNDNIFKQVDENHIILIAESKSVNDETTNDISLITNEEHNNHVADTRDENIIEIMNDEENMINNVCNEVEIETTEILSEDLQSVNNEATEDLILTSEKEPNKEVVIELSNNPMEDPKSVDNEAIEHPAETSEKESNNDILIELSNNPMEDPQSINHEATENLIMTSEKEPNKDIVIELSSKTIEDSQSINEATEHLTETSEKEPNKEIVIEISSNPIEDPQSTNDEATEHLTETSEKEPNKEIVIEISSNPIEDPQSTNDEATEHLTETSEKEPNKEIVIEISSNPIEDPQSINNEAIEHLAETSEKEPNSDIVIELSSNLMEDPQSINNEATEQLTKTSEIESNSYILIELPSDTTDIGDKKDTEKVDNSVEGPILESPQQTKETKGKVIKNKITSSKSKLVNSLVAGDKKELRSSAKKNKISRDDIETNDKKNDADAINIIEEVVDDYDSFDEEQQKDYRFTDLNKISKEDILKIIHTDEEINEVTSDCTSNNVESGKNKANIETNVPVKSKVDHDIKGEKITRNKKKTKSPCLADNKIIPDSTIDHEELNDNVIDSEHSSKRKKSKNKVKAGKIKGVITKNCSIKKRRKKRTSKIKHKFNKKIVIDNRTICAKTVENTIMQEDEIKDHNKKIKPGRKSAEIKRNSSTKIVTDKNVASVIEGCITRSKQLKRKSTEIKNDTNAVMVTSSNILSAILADNSIIKNATIDSSIKNKKQKRKKKKIKKKSTIMVTNNKRVCVPNKDKIIIKDGKNCNEKNKQERKVTKTENDSSTVIVQDNNKKCAINTDNIVVEEDTIKDCNKKNKQERKKLGEIRKKSTTMVTDNKTVSSLNEDNNVVENATKDCKKRNELEKKKVTEIENDFNSVMVKNNTKVCAVNVDNTIVENATEDSNKRNKQAKRKISEIVKKSNATIVTDNKTICASNEDKSASKDITNDCDENNKQEERKVTEIENDSNSEMIKDNSKVCTINADNSIVEVAIKDCNKSNEQEKRKISEFKKKSTIVVTDKKILNEDNIVAVSGTKDCNNRSEQKKPKLSEIENDSNSVMVKDNKIYEENADNTIVENATEDFNTRIEQEKLKPSEIKNDSNSVMTKDEVCAGNKDNTVTENGTKDCNKRSKQENLKPSEIENDCNSVTVKDSTKVCVENEDNTDAENNTKVCNKRSEQEKLKPSEIENDSNSATVKDKTKVCAENADNTTVENATEDSNKRIEQEKKKASEIKNKSIMLVTDNETLCASNEDNTVAEDVIKDCNKRSEQEKLKISESENDSNSVMVKDNKVYEENTDNTFVENATEDSNKRIEQEKRKTSEIKKKSTMMVTDNKALCVLNEDNTVAEDVTKDHNKRSKQEKRKLTEIEDNSNTLMNEANNKSNASSPGKKLKKITDDENVKDLNNQNKQEEKNNIEIKNKSNAVTVTDNKTVYAEKSNENIVEVNVTKNCKGKNEQKKRKIDDIENDVDSEKITDNEKVCATSVNKMLKNITVEENVQNDCNKKNKEEKIEITEVENNSNIVTDNNTIIAVKANNISVEEDVIKDCKKMNEQEKQQISENNSNTEMVSDNNIVCTASADDSVVEENISKDNKKSNKEDKRKNDEMKNSLMATYDNTDCAINTDNTLKKTTIEENVKNLEKSENIEIENSSNTAVNTNNLVSEEDVDINVVEEDVTKDFNKSNEREEREKTEIEDNLNIVMAEDEVLDKDATEEKRLLNKSNVDDSKVVDDEIIDVVGFDNNIDENCSENKSKSNIEKSKQQQNSLDTYDNEDDKSKINSLITQCKEQMSDSDSDDNEQMVIDDMSDHESSEEIDIEEYKVDISTIKDNQIGASSSNATQSQSQYNSDMDGEEISDNDMSIIVCSSGEDDEEIEIVNVTDVANSEEENMLKIKKAYEEVSTASEVDAALESHGIFDRALISYADKIPDLLHISDSSDDEDIDTKVDQRLLEPTVQILEEPNITIKELPVQPKPAVDENAKIRSALTRCIIKSGNIPTEKALKCWKCKEIYFGVNRLKKHIRYCGVQPYLECSLCITKKIMFKHKKSLVRHLQSTHLGQIKPEDMSRIILDIVSKGNARLSSQTVFSKSQSLSSSFPEQILEMNIPDYVSLSCNKCHKSYNTISTTYTKYCDTCTVPLILVCNKCATRCVASKKVTNHIRGTCDGNGIMKCPKCEYSSKNVSNVHEHILRKHTYIDPKDFVPCPKCNAKFKIREAMLKHLRYCDREKDLVCKFCPFKTKYSSVIKSHLQQHIITSSPSQCSKDLNRAPANPSGKQKLLGKISLTSFKRSKEYITAICTRCNKSVEIKEHYQRQRGCCDDRNCKAPLFFQCKVCPWKRGLYSMVRIHVLRVHTEKTNQCPNCKKTYGYIKDFYDHVDRCGTSPNYECTKCQFVTHYKKNLDLHMRHRHPKADTVYIQCSKCSKKFNSKQSLVRHQRHFCGIEPKILCEHCKFKTRSKFSIIRHIQSMHTDLFNNCEFQCKFCAKKFNKLYSYDNHSKKCEIKNFDQKLSQENYKSILNQTA